MEGIYAKSPESYTTTWGKLKRQFPHSSQRFETEKSGVGGSLYDKVVQILLYATVVLMPLFYLPWTSSVLEYNKQMLLVVVAAVGVVVWLLGAVVSGKLTVRMSPLDKGVLRC